MSRGNLHTHTVFCDGKDSPEELVQRAIALGCDVIGFSGHSYTDIHEDNPFCMSLEGTNKYKNEINRLKKDYEGQIKILLGVEQDYYSPYPADGYDYVIGSVHYVLKDGVYIPVDDTKEKQVNAVKKYYNGDYYSFIEDYFRLVGDVYEKTGCNIVGHFDLVTKFNEDGCLFDTSHPRYINAADEALCRLLSENVSFEINYGAISRGYRSEPYPEERIIDRIRAVGGRLIKTSDCHDKNYLMFGIDQ